MVETIGASIGAAPAADEMLILLWREIGSLAQIGLYPKG